MPCAECGGPSGDGVEKPVCDCWKQQHSPARREELQLLALARYFARRDRQAFDEKARPSGVAAVRGQFGNHRARRSTAMKTLTRVGVLLAAAVLLVGIGAAAAQTPVVINPTTISWTASADHDTVLSDGTAILTRYEVRVFMAGATAPFQVYDAGKPAPANGTITVVNPGWLTLSAMNTEGFAKVAAIGPAGEGVSESSNPFARVGPPAVTPAPAVRR